MKNIRKIFSLLLIGVCAVVGSIALTGCGKKDDATAPPDETPQAVTKTIEGINYYRAGDSDEFVVTGCDAEIINATNIVQIEDEIDGCEVTKINRDAFYQEDNSTNKVKLRSIVIPNTITSIDGAFSNCKDLTSITFESGSQIKQIGLGTFVGCSSLETLEIPASVEILGVYHEGQNNTAQTGVVFENSAINTVTFEQNSKLKTIGSHAFYRATELESITLPYGVEYIGNSNFEHCTNLSIASLPTSIKYIGRFNFSSLNLDNYIATDDIYYISGRDANGTVSNQYFAAIGVEDKTITSCTINIDTRILVGSLFSGCGSLTSVTFANTYGWHTSLYGTLTSIDVSNPANNVILDAMYRVVE